MTLLTRRENNADKLMFRLQFSQARTCKLNLFSFIRFRQNKLSPQRIYYNEYESCIIVTARHKIQISTETEHPSYPEFYTCSSPSIFMAYFIFFYAFCNNKNILSAIIRIQQTFSAKHVFDWIKVCVVQHESSLPLVHFLKCKLANKRPQR